MSKKRGGGVACYVADKYAPFSTIRNDLSFVDKNLECLCVETKFPNQKYRLVFSVYRPPRGNVKLCYTKLSEVQVSLADH